VIGAGGKTFMIREAFVKKEVRQVLASKYFDGDSGTDKCLPSILHIQSPQLLEEVCKECGEVYHIR